MNIKNFCKSVVLLFVFSFLSTYPLRDIQNVSEKMCSKTRHLLYSPDFEKTYACVDYSNGGYYIAEYDSEIVLEYNPTGQSPYFDCTNEVCIYGGPMNYFTLSKQNRIVPKKKLIGSKMSFKKADEAIDLLAMTDDSEEFIDDYELISKLYDFDRYVNGKASTQYNNDGTCGYVAAAILLYYNKYKYNTNFIANKYIEYTSNGQRRFTAAFHDYLVSQFGEGNFTTAFSIKKVMDKYCKSIGINTNHYAMLLSTRANIDLCIQANKPVLLFGNFQTPDKKEKVNHAVTCYGIETISSINGEAMRYFIVNYGWTGCSQVYLLDNLFTNPVGSMYNMNY